MIDRQNAQTDFRLYWAGETVSNLGSSFTLFALPLLALSALWFGDRCVGGSAGSQAAHDLD
jgi:hypothetical protein